MKSVPRKKSSHLHHRSGAAGSLVQGLVVIAALLAIVTVGTAPAGASTPGGVPPVGEPPSATSVAAEGMAGFGLYGEDYFVTIGIGTTISFDKVSLGLQAPLKIRVIDNEPDNDTWYRQEDWDEVSDWTRIIRFIQYGNPNEPVYVRLGELAAATIGHGTIVHRYYNTLELDHYHTGLAAKVDIEEYGGGEFLTNDILKWNLVAIRGFVRPLSFALENPADILKRFVAGVTFASDFLAPYEIKVDQASGSWQMDTDKNLEFESRAAWFLGLDVGIEVLRETWGSITPYMDLNFFRGLGTGYHLGVLNNFVIGALDTELEVRLEYRLLSSRYAPAYFNTLYDLERFAFLPISSSGVQVPKFAFYKDAEGLEMRHGFYGELYANIAGLVGIGGIFEDYQGPDNASVTLRADLPYISGVKLAAYYTRRNFDGLSELFDLDDAYLVAEARVKLSGPLFLFALYSVYWQLIDDETSPDHGTYDSTDSFQAGVGVAFSF